VEPQSERESAVKTICLHGAESTGKSTLGISLAARLGCELVPEYGRAYCEENSNEVNMDELVHIGEMQLKLIRKAVERGKDWLVIDTDAITTAVWAQIMHGKKDIWFSTIDFHADLYLVLDSDLAFVQDAVRVYAGEDERQIFHALNLKELKARRCKWVSVGGVGPARMQNALAAISEHMA
jgi:NadR type nicotinamide-nucleotide adenylyltransferase